MFSWGRPTCRAAALESYACTETVEEGEEVGLACLLICGLVSESNGGGPHCVVHQDNPTIRPARETYIL